MVKKNGKYALGIRFSNRDSLQTNINVNVNNVDNEVFTPNTQYDDSYLMSWFFTDLYIKKNGQNNIKITADSSIYIDCLVLDYLDNV